MGLKLYELIEELTKGGVSGSTLRRQFMNYPDALAKDLTPEAQKALYSMDHQDNGAIATFVEAELKAVGMEFQFPDWKKWFKGWGFPLDEFIPPNSLPKDCQYEAQAGPSYPEPVPMVYEVDPPKIIQGNIKIDTEIMISGQGFVSGRTRCALVPKGAGPVLDLAPKYSGVEGTFRCGHLYLAFKSQPPAVMQDENYRIDVTICTGVSGGNPVEWTLPRRKDKNGVEIEFVLQK